MIQEEIFIKSSLDGTMQPSLYYAAEGEASRPLLVGLHTWSFDRYNPIEYLLGFAEEENFNLLLPEFRGPNFYSSPEPMKTCGSIYAKQDIKDAIDHIVDTRTVDKDNIFLVGLSGGGHMAMLMAGYCPEYFKAIAPFVPISDIAVWKEECPEGYVKHIIACTNGDSGEMYDRSPVKYMDTIAKANMKIFHGKRDNVVPVHQSIDFYCEMMKRHPNANIYLDVFDGGHQFDVSLCKNWIMAQYGKREISNVTG